jgi:hypothetical protein
MVASSASARVGRRGWLTLGWLTLGWLTLGWLARDWLPPGWITFEHILEV